MKGQKTWLQQLLLFWGLGTTELPFSHVLVKDCHSDVTPANNSNSDVFTLDTIALIMKQHHRTSWVISAQVVSALSRFGRIL